MSIKEFKKYEANAIKEKLCGLVIRKGEKGKLYEICIKYGIPITYPNLFDDEIHYILWGISENGIGLIGTVIMNYLSENNGTIFQSLDELEEYLKKESLCRL